VVDLQAVNPSPRPSPRLWQSMTADPGLHSSGSISNAHVALMFGGKRGSGAYSDSLWGLWILRDGTVGWQVRGTGSTGTAPGARARHSATFDSQQSPYGRLYVYGGETGSGAADSYAYMIDTWKNSLPTPDSTWKRWQDRGFTLSGHSVVQDNGNETARIPEVYDPSTNQWTPLGGSPLAEINYPPAFMVPGAGNEKSRVININNDTLLTYYLDIPKSGQPGELPGEWQKWANGSTGFAAKTGVQYRPGWIMVAGGDSGSSITGRTRTLDTSNLSNSWEVTNGMAPRTHHNLVALPTGQVLAVGGNSRFDHVTADPVKRPQLWTPNTPGGGGTWTSISGADTLSEQATARTDHSTAILLPDGRVLSAGGETPADKYVANLYCPPYLFKSDGTTLAARPTITYTPRQVTWGQSFTLCTPQRSSITRVSLIAPAATTHSVDMNQRYVPLVFSNGPNPTELTVNAPASPDSAPPGFYLLFLTGSGDGTDVPSIATWVRVGPADTGDATAPANNDDLAPDMISSSSISVTWTAPADDGLSAASGMAKESDLRYWTSAITNEAQWNLATTAQCEPTVGVVGTSHGLNLTGLLSCTWHYFQLRTWDDKPQLSGLHYEVKAKTTCSGGGGGGLSAGRVREEGLGKERTTDFAREHEAGGGGPAATHPAGVPGRLPAQAAGMRAESGVLFAESSRDEATGRWSVVLGSLTPPGDESPENAAAALIQARSSNGTWQTVASHLPGPGDQELMVPVLRNNRRIVFPAGFELGACGGITSGAGAGSLGILSGSSTTRGSLDVSSGLGDLAFADGEVVTLTYEPVEGTPTTADDAALSAVRGGTTPTRLRRRPPEARAVTVQQFALHSAQPNPATDRLTLRFELPRETDVRLEIFDLLGRRVQTLAHGSMPAGIHRVSWDRKTTEGLRLAAGLYLARLTTTTDRAETKFALIP
ncbi:MAG: galactose oxidase-like domain-containing protein, partial [Candidatus Eisenbacteria bacterium]